MFFTSHESRGASKFNFLFLFRKLQNNNNKEKEKEKKIDWQEKEILFTHNK